MAGFFWVVELNRNSERIPRSLLQGNLQLRPLRLFLQFLGGQHIHIRQIRSQVSAFVFAQNAHGQAYQGPQVHRMIAALKVFA